MTGKDLEGKLIIRLCTRSDIACVSAEEYDVTKSEAINCPTIEGGRSGFKLYCLTGSGFPVMGLNTAYIREVVIPDDEEVRLVRTDSTGVMDIWVDKFRTTGPRRDTSVLRTWLYFNSLGYDVDKMGALFAYALTANNVTLVKGLIENDISEINPVGCDSIKMAIFNESYDMVKLLTDKGASVITKDYEPLLMCAQTNQIDTWQHIVHHWLKCDTFDKQACFDKCIEITEANHYDDFTELIKKTFSI